MASPQKVAILGGGIGGLVAAFELTRDPDWRRRREVTVYQQGWLLGGKGASVRNLDHRARIEEHGLHIWMGFYENAFQVIRECYRELGRPRGAPLATWEEAFQRHDFLVVQEQVEGRWTPWRMDFPRNDSVPGDGGEFPGGGDYVGMILRWLLGLLTDWNQAHATVYPGRRGRLAEMARSLELIVSSLEVASAAVTVSLGAVAAHGAGILERAPGDGGLTDWLEQFLRRAWEALQPDIASDVDVRRLWFWVDFAVAVVRGLVRDGLTSPRADFSALDHYDLREWLRLHGARESTVHEAPIRGLYELVFADGETLAAGSMLNASLRMILAYKGSIFYKMQAGMGETIFAPLYAVLRRRGVRFEFFHRVRHLELDPASTSVATVRLGRQATVASGEYDPLVDVDGLPCWPHRPRYEQLVEGDALRASGADLVSHWCSWPDVEEVTLRAGEHFDRLVLAIPGCALKEVGRELVEALPSWRDAVYGLRSVKTQAMQLWFSGSTADLGWTLPSPVLSAYAEPFDTWCDMSHLIPRERWRPEDGVQSVAYFCGALGTASELPGEDGRCHATERARVRSGALRWLRESCGALLPGAADAGGLRWERLVDPGGGVGEERLDAQYLRANVNPTDRYMLSVAGTTRLRLRADRTGLDNLVVAGDWTLNGLNVGSVEAATMSGLQAARALDGRPRRIVGEPAGWDPHATATHGLGARYVERPGDVAPCQPYALSEVEMHVFGLDADLDALGRLCDRCLNEPSGGAVRYVPAVPWVALVCADAGAARSRDPRGASLGWLPEVDVAVWIPVLAAPRPGRRSLASRLRWFLPYVFVDSDVAAFAGREIYGFPKAVARVERRRDASGLIDLTLDTTLRRERGAGSRLALDRLLQVRRVEEAEERGARDWVYGRVGDLTESFLQGRFGDELTLVFLKQLRDAADPRRACYQAVVEARARALTVRSGRPLAGRYEVRWSDADSHPIRRELGLSGPLQTPWCALRFDLDFVMEAGAEVWRA
jgi:uncharacterized protein with NAD-binding domain and iron-sulfur cluster